MAYVTLPGKTGYALIAPFRKAKELIDTALNPRTGCLKTIGCSLTARALIIAQTIVSLVSFPFFFIATLFSALASCCGLNRTVYEESKKNLTDHFLISVAAPFFAVLPLKCLPT